MAAAHVEGEAVVAWVGWVPTKNWISRSVKGMETVSVPPAQYLPGQRRKKKAIQERSAIDFPLVKLPWEIESMQWRMETGRVLMFPPDPVRVDARRWYGLRYTRDRRRDSLTNHRCAKIGCNRA